MRHHRSRFETLESENALAGWDNIVGSPLGYSEQRAKRRGVAPFTGRRRADAQGCDAYKYTVKRLRRVLKGCRPFDPESTQQSRPGVSRLCRVCVDGWRRRARLPSLGCERVPAPYLSEAPSHETQRVDRDPVASPQGLHRRGGERAHRHHRGCHGGDRAPPGSGREQRQTASDPGRALGTRGSGLRKPRSRGLRAARSRGGRGCGTDPGPGPRGDRGPRHSFSPWRPRAGAAGLPDDLGRAMGLPLLEARGVEGGSVARDHRWLRGSSTRDARP